MKRALLLLLVACGSSTPATNGPGGSSGNGGRSGGGTGGGGGGASGGTYMQNGGGGNQHLTGYSCFSYSQGGSTVKRSACMRTDECDPYLEQAKQVGGITQISGCASVESLWCFHQSATKADSEGADVCQPSIDACKSERDLIVKAGTSVDTACAPR